MPVKLLLSYEAKTNIATTMLEIALLKVLLDGSMLSKNMCVQIRVLGNRTPLAETNLLVMGKLFKGYNIF